MSPGVVSGAGPGDPPDMAHHVPVRREDVHSGEDAAGLVTLRRRKMGRAGTALLRLFRISPDLTVHLDGMGSEVWRLIDGGRTAGELLVAMEANHPDEEDLNLRLGQYISILASNRFIRLQPPPQT